MSARQKIWARKTRSKILHALGPWCVVCGATDFLEFDCIKPTGDGHHKLEWSHRMSFYRRQFAAGNLQVLCQRCNARKGDDDMEAVFGSMLSGLMRPLPQAEIENQPF